MGCSVQERELGIPTPSPSPPLPFSHFPGPGVPLTTGHQALARYSDRSLTIHSLPSRWAVPRGEGARGRAAGRRALVERGQSCCHHALSTACAPLLPSWAHLAPAPWASRPPASSHGSCRRLSQVCPKHLQQEQVLSLLWFEGGPLSICN